jgi:hypothetical protein
MDRRSLKGRGDPFCLLPILPPLTFRKLLQVDAARPIPYPVNFKLRMHG